jgi:putative redox protein
MKPPSRVEVRWAGGNRFDAGRPGRPSIRIDGGAETGPGPVDTLLCALAACTSEDVIGIIGKRRTPVSALRIEVEGVRADAVPARLTSIALTYHIDGDGVEPDQAQRAVDLAVEKYCSVRDSLAKDIPITARAIVNGTPVSGQ